MQKRKVKAVVKKLLNSHPESVVMVHNDGTFRVFEMYEKDNKIFLVHFKYSSTGETLLSCDPRVCDEDSIERVIDSFA